MKFSDEDYNMNVFNIFESEVPPFTDLVGNVLDISWTCPKVRDL